jgi:hypothetical protein
MTPPAAGRASAVDVIVTNHNYELFLADAIDSALGQAGPLGSVIVVDDGSTDGSRALIESYGDRVVPILKQNGGQASAFNAGFSHTRSEAVIFLDADDALLPSAVTAVAGAFAANPGAAKVQYRMQTIDRLGERLAAQKPLPHLRMPSGDLTRAELDYPFDLAWLPTSGNAFAADVLRRIFPVPEAEFALGADWYVAHLAPLFGAVVSLEESLASYRVHDTNRYELANGALTLRHVRQSIEYADLTRHHLERYAGELGLPVGRGGVVSVSDVANRLVSLRLEPEAHPITSDTRIGLVLEGMRAAARRSDISAALKALFVLWFLCAAAAPRSAARRLAEVFFLPQRRQPVNRLLGALHRA